VRLETLIGWSFLVEGRIPDGLAALNQAEAAARSANAFALHAELAVTRAAFFVLSGDAASALPLLRTALERAAGKKLSGADLNAVRRGVAAWRVRADAQLGRAREAQEALAALEAEAVAPANRGLVTVVRGLRPLVAEAHGDVSAALALTAQCAASDWLCRADRVRLAGKMGDAATAAEVRRALVAERRRDTIWSSLEPTYLWAWSRLRPDTTARNDSH
jgi:hypothetical protein